MLNPMSILVSAALLILAGVAAGQPAPQVERQTCELMSREEMQLCLNTKQGDVSGARSVRCDQLSRTTIEACLRQEPSEATANASSGGHAPRRDAAPMAAAPNDAASSDGERR